MDEREVARHYVRQTPFREVWRELSLAEHRPALEFWFEWAGRDPWGYTELVALGGDLIENGITPPPPLDRFLADVLRLKWPKPRNTKLWRDIHIAALVQLGVEHGDMSQRAACREIAGALNLSYDAVESARRSGESV